MARTGITALLLRISKQSADTSLHLCQHWGCAEIKWPARCHQVGCGSRSISAPTPPSTASSTLDPLMHPEHQDGVLQRKMKPPPSPTPPRAWGLGKSGIRRLLIKERSGPLFISLHAPREVRANPAHSQPCHKKPRAIACAKHFIPLQPSSVIKESGTLIPAEAGETATSSWCHPPPPPAPFSPRAGVGAWESAQLPEGVAANMARKEKEQWAAWLGLAFCY